MANTTSLNMGDPRERFIGGTVGSRQFNDSAATMISSAISRNEFKKHLMDDPRMQEFHETVIRMVAGWSTEDKIAIITEYGDGGLIRSNNNLKTKDLDRICAEAIIVHLKPEDLRQLYNDISVKEKKLMAETRAATSRGFAGRAAALRGIKAREFRRAKAFFNTDTFEQANELTKSAENAHQFLKRVNIFDYSYKVPREIKGQFRTLRNELLDVLKTCYNKIELMQLASLMGIEAPDMPRVKESWLFTQIINKTCLYVSLVTGKSKRNYGNAIMNVEPYHELLRYTSYSYITGQPGLSAEEWAELKRQARRAKNTMIERAKMQKKHNRANRKELKNLTDGVAGGRRSLKRKIKYDDTGILADMTTEELLALAGRYGIDVSKRKNLKVNNLKAQIYIAMALENKRVLQLSKKEGKAYGRNRIDRNIGDLLSVHTYRSRPSAPIVSNPVIPPPTGPLAPAPLADNTQPSQAPANNVPANNPLAPLQIPAPVVNVSNDTLIPLVHFNIKGALLEKIISQAVPVFIVGQGVPGFLQPNFKFNEGSKTSTEYTNPGARNGKKGIALSSMRDRRMDTIAPQLKIDKNEVPKEDMNALTHILGLTDTRPANPLDTNFNAGIVNTLHELRIYLIDNRISIALLNRIDNASIPDSSDGHHYRNIAYAVLWAVVNKRDILRRYISDEYGVSFTQPYGRGIERFHPFRFSTLAHGLRIGTRNIAKFFHNLRLSNIAKNNNPKSFDDLSPENKKLYNELQARFPSYEEGYQACKNELILHTRIRESAFIAFENAAWGFPKSGYPGAEFMTDDSIRKILILAIKSLYAYYKNDKLLAILYQNLANVQIGVGSGIISRDTSARANNENNLHGAYNVLCNQLMGRRAISRLFRGNARRINTIKNLFSRKGDSIITENADRGNNNMLANPIDTNDAQRLAIPKIYWSPELTDDELDASIVEVVPVYVVNTLKQTSSKSAAPDLSKEISKLNSSLFSISKYIENYLPEISNTGLNTFDILKNNVSTIDLISDTETDIFKVSNQYLPKIENTNIVLLQYLPKIANKLEYIKNDFGKNLFNIFKHIETYLPEISNTIKNDDTNKDVFSILKHIETYLPEISNTNSNQFDLIKNNINVVDTISDIYVLLNKTLNASSSPSNSSIFRGLPTGTGRTNATGQGLQNRIITAHDYNSKFNENMDDNLWVEVDNEAYPRMLDALVGRKYAIDSTQAKTTPFRRTKDGKIYYQATKETINRAIDFGVPFSSSTVPAYSLSEDQLSLGGAKALSGNNFPNMNDADILNRAKVITAAILKNYSNQRANAQTLNANDDSDNSNMPRKSRKDKKEPVEDGRKLKTVKLAELSGKVRHGSKSILSENAMNRLKITEVISEPAIPVYVTNTFSSFADMLQTELQYMSSRVDAAADEIVGSIGGQLGNLMLGLSAGVMAAPFGVGAITYPGLIANGVMGTVASAIDTATDISTDIMQSSMNQGKKAYGSVSNLHTGGKVYRAATGAVFNKTMNAPSAAMAARDTKSKLQNATDTLTNSNISVITGDAAGGDIFANGAKPELVSSSSDIEVTPLNKEGTENRTKVSRMTLQERKQALATAISSHVVRYNYKLPDGAEDVSNIGEAIKVFNVKPGLNDEVNINGTTISALQILANIYNQLLTLNTSNTSNTQLLAALASSMKNAASSGSLEGSSVAPGDFPTSLDGILGGD